MKKCPKVKNKVNEKKKMRKRFQSGSLLSFLGERDRKNKNEIVGAKNVRLSDLGCHVRASWPMGSKAANVGRWAATKNQIPGKKNGTPHEWNHPVPTQSDSSRQKLAGVFQNITFSSIVEKVQFFFFGRCLRA